jgi:4-hydroxybenzoate polyprenyltransferase
MGNRFAGLTEYHQLIVGHGVIAALTFLFIVPAAIMTARFYSRNGVLALRMHVWLQIITMFLATIVLILGWFAVGPSRSLTNPHHGIGVAIYTLVLFQAIYGAWVRHHESKRVRNHIPIKLMVRHFSPGRKCIN